jgi:hypothetical protein
MKKQPLRNIPAVEIRNRFVERPGNISMMLMAGARY